MRTIEVSEVTKLVRQLCIDANYYLPGRSAAGVRGWSERGGVSARQDHLR